MTAISKIVQFRRQERLLLVVTSLASSISATVWLPAPMVVTWLIVTVIGIVIGHRNFGRIARNRENEWSLAAMTFAAASWYALLPLAMVTQGAQLATLTGVCIAGSMALRGANEFTVSKPIGLATLGALMLIACIGAFWRSIPARLPELAAVLTGVGLLFTYILQHANQRRDAETGMATAVRDAERNERQAQAASEAKSAFLATMSHEIRTPLNGVLGMAQALAATTMDADQRHLLGVIQGSGAALQAVLDDVLDLARIEAGKLETSAVDFEPAVVARSAFDSFESLARQKGLEFELHIGATALGRYRGDPIRLRQVLNNLLSNAIKFTERGKIALSVVQIAGRFRFEVADTGIGIPADKQNQLFKTFSQIDQSLTRRHGGSGLGLSICQALCELMGGDITVDSRAGEGATFTVNLPFPGASAMELSGLDALAPSPPEILPRVRVLAAEDNPVNQLVLKTLLEQVDISPLIVGDGQQAIDAWRDRDWDILLMDVQMPLVDGLAATRTIRRIEADQLRRRTPVVALTANAMAHQIAEYQAAGMDACIAKPINAAQLYSVLDEVVRQNSVTGIDQHRYSGLP